MFVWGSATICLWFFLVSISYIVVTNVLKILESFMTVMDLTTISEEPTCNLVFVASSVLLMKDVNEIGEDKCSSTSFNWSPSWIWSTQDIPSRFVIKKLIRVRSETSYGPSQLPARVDRGQEQMKKVICICEIFKSKTFSKNMHLKLYRLLQFGSPSKTPQQNFVTVPTSDSNKDLPSKALVKVPAQDPIKISSKLAIVNC